MNETAHCRKHGEVPLWIVCRHVAEGKADTVVFTDNRDGLCFDCAHNFKELGEEDVALMCKECLKDFVAKLMIDARTLANIKERVLGLEHLDWKGPVPEETAEG